MRYDESVIALKGQEETCNKSTFGNNNPWIQEAAVAL
jgi:hypothetical protein